ncbi:hypothetical protein AB0D78_35345 [Streptomyces avermitilis]
MDFKGPYRAGVKEGRFMAYGDYQDEVYMDGLRGVVPRFPMTYDELEPLAQAAMPTSVRSYVAGGAGRRAHPAGQRPRETSCVCGSREGRIRLMEFEGAPARLVRVFFFEVQSAVESLAGCCLAHMSHVAEQACR